MGEKRQFHLRSKVLVVSSSKMLYWQGKKKLFAPVKHLLQLKKANLLKSVYGAMSQTIKEFLK